jgi:hypothetical protein
LNQELTGKTMRSSKALLIAALWLSATGAVFAKLPSPPLTDEQKAKAEEAKVKAAEAAKIEADQLAKAMDRVADGYIKAQKTKGIMVKPTPITAPAAPAPAAVAVPAPAAAAAPAKK